MNITDIDDKIIKRARQNYLYEKYVQEDHELDAILEDTKEVVAAVEETVRTTTDTDKKIMLDNMLVKVIAAVENLEQAVKTGVHEKITESQKNLLNEARDPLSDWLDKKNGATVTENAIFNKLSQHWEAEYHKDMDALNVMTPNVLTRVSEYVPEIVEYIKKIMDNGLAYVSNGSVYFDVASFDKKDKHHYAKLVPEAYGDASSLQEGEGKLI